MKKNRKVYLVGEEKFVIFVTLFSIIGIFAVQIFLGAQISNIKMNIEKIDYKIESQTKKNESLTMQINELTSYENVSSVIDNLGLSYNNENIIVITK